MQKQTQTPAQKELLEFALALEARMHAAANHSLEALGFVFIEARRELDGIMARLEAEGPPVQ
jgi:hypothetical protein